MTSIGPPGSLGQHLTGSVHGDRPARIVSLDVFRGLTIAAMILVNNPGSWSHVYGPLRHARWHGWTFADVVFPFFLFIVGVSVAVSLGGRLEKGEMRRPLCVKIMRRALVLFALGLLLNGFPFYELSTLRIPGVLQRIAVCYLAAAVIFLNSGWKGQLAWAAGLMLLHWATMEWIPVPGIGAGHYTRGSNLASWIDGRLLAGHMWAVTRTWDPEGILSTVPAVSTTLSGVLAGSWLKSNRTTPDKTVWLLVAGSMALVIGALWHAWLPINKSLWTGSYSVFMAGLACICLGAICYLVDIRGWKGWTRPARVLGMNSITAYVLAGIAARLLVLVRVAGAGGKTVTVKAWAYGSSFASWLGPMNASLAYAVAFIIVMYLCMLILYRKKIFIKT